MFDHLGMGDAFCGFSTDESAKTTIPTQTILTHSQLSTHTKNVHTQPNYLVKLSKCRRRMFLTPILLCRILYMSLQVHQRQVIYDTKLGVVQIDFKPGLLSIIMGCIIVQARIIMVVSVGIRLIIE